MGDLTKFLKPCLVIGTGFHRWLIGDRAENSPIGNWRRLLADVASRMAVSWHDDRAANPVFLWERLLHTAARDGYQFSEGLEDRWIGAGRHAIYDIEKDAKKVVAHLIKDECDAYPNKSRRAEYPLSRQWGAVISLNFETAWFDGTGVFIRDAFEHPMLGHLDSDERHRLTDFLELKSSRIWFPNGYVEMPTTLRLGLRDFGLQPSEIRSGFEVLKQFERGVFCPYDAGSVEQVWARNHAHKSQYLEPINNVLPLGESIARLKFPLNWVADFIYRPLFFAGAGLAQEELGLWWLLNQRQRNYARVDSKHIPPVYVLVHTDDKRLKFWQTRPFGIEPIVCCQWDEGWRLVEERAAAFFSAAIS